MYEYWLLTTDLVEDFNMLLSRLARKSWEPFGTLVVTQNHRSDHPLHQFVYSQMMRRPKDGPLPDRVEI